MDRAWAALFLLAVASLSGCVEREASTGDRSPALDAAPVVGHMTGIERSQTWTGLCPGSQQPPLQLTQSPPRYCGTREVWIEGEVDLAELPVVMEVTNGDIVLEFSNGPDWNLTFVARASGKSSLEEARRTIENFDPRWSHEERGGHFLRAEGRTKSRPCNADCPRITVTLRAPDNLFIRAALDATNGDVVAGGHQYSHLVASSTNGDVVLRESITRDVVLETTNGDIAIKSRPYESGRWRLDTTNGAIAVQVPEGARHGYEVSADTTTGTASITLRDGTVSGSARSKTFETHGYASREVQTRIVADTTNGEVSVAPL